MTEVGVHEAKTHLSALLARVEAGEEIVVSRSGIPVAKLVPIRPTRRELGFVPYVVPDSFVESLPEEELQRWEG